ncbi:hypothetical protein QFC19_003658 [Naganishia cerealis]|uniref:Uncharacterized protein n=1 Tax=Naganishia cerealis TaxID=610337 RepID=A0ACC2W1Q5_9TREE|nr:hypothetical protein QFC19_003658 [Naganishia cerealis]
MLTKLATVTAALVCLSQIQLVLGAYVPYQKRANGTCCGYVVTNRNDGYFRYKHTIDFSALTSMDKVYQAGWEISDGWQAGGTNFITGQVPWADDRNVELIKGEGLRLKVPSGVFEIEAKMTTIPGTCMGMFTSHADNDLPAPLGWQDEQDIEMLGASMLQATSLQPAGIQMINWDPNNTARRTEMRLDGNLLNSPQNFPSINPSVLILNHWTNADGRWSAGPPAQDAHMTIKKVTAYYDKPAKMATGTGILKQETCNRALACKVTV